MPNRCACISAISPIKKLRKKRRRLRKPPPQGRSLLVPRLPPARPPNLPGLWSFPATRSLPTQPQHPACILPLVSRPSLLPFLPLRLCQGTRLLRGQRWYRHVLLLPFRLLLRLLPLGQGPRLLSSRRLRPLPHLLLQPSPPQRRLLQLVPALLLLYVRLLRPPSRDSPSVPLRLAPLPPLRGLPGHLV
jgi:hypothetical protein